MEEAAGRREAPPQVIPFKSWGELCFGEGAGIMTEAFTWLLPFSVRFPE